MADVIDTREAVRCLDMYTDDLISLALLARSSTFQDTADGEMREIHEGVKSIPPGSVATDDLSDADAAMFASLTWSGQVS